MILEAFTRKEHYLRFLKREEGSGWGTHIYMWQIHFDIWQNQYNIVKFKNKIKLKKKITAELKDSGFVEPETMQEVKKNLKKSNLSSIKYKNVEILKH